MKKSAPAASRFGGRRDAGGTVHRRNAGGTPCMPFSPFPAGRTPAGRFTGGMPVLRPVCRFHHSPPAERRRDGSPAECRCCAGMPFSPFPAGRMPTGRFTGGMPALRPVCRFHHSPPAERRRDGSPAECRCCAGMPFSPFPAGRMPTGRFTGGMPALRRYAVFAISRRPNAGRTPPVASAFSR